MNTFDPQSDDRTKKLFSTLGVEQPSADFTARLMEQVYAEAAKGKFVYKPLISGKAFGWILFMAFLLLIGLWFLAGNNGSLSDPKETTGDQLLALVGQSSAWVNRGLPLLQNIFHVALGLLIFWVLLVFDKLLAGFRRQQAI
jgi:hypothetical protein